MSKDLMMHKGFTGSMEASIEDECLHGRILFIDDIVTYEGETVAELKDSFVAAVATATSPIAGGQGSRRTNPLVDPSTSE